MEQIVTIIIDFLTDPVQVVLFLFACVFYKHWAFAAKKLEELHVEYNKKLEEMHEEYIEKIEEMYSKYVGLFKSQTDSNNKLSDSLTSINHTISVLTERIK